MELKELKSLITNFYSVKSMADNFKKESDKINKDIKKGMAESNLDTVDVEEEGLVCELKIQERKSFNTPKLVEYLKGLDVELPGVIEVVETVNEDALENAIYNGLIDASKLNEFVVVKPVQVLKVKKK